MVVQLRGKTLLVIYRKINNMSTMQNFTGYSPTWCPGCGNWSIVMALKGALVKAELDPSSVFLSFGIGCSGNMNDFLNGYAIHGLHGRAIPTAIGMKLANHKMKTVVIAGDGDCYGEGGNHFLHACRGNHDITVIIHDNRVYGLTTGQTAPTADKGYKSKSTPLGIIEVPIDPLSLAITQGATFVSQSFAGNVPHLTEIILFALKHTGFSLVNVLQPCVTFNKINTYSYYTQRMYKLPDDYDPSDRNVALEKANEIKKEKFPLGIIFKSDRKAFHQELPQIAEQSLVEKERFSCYDSLLNDFI